jgi:hypothetical protein
VAKGTIDRSNLIRLKHGPENAMRLSGKIMRRQQAEAEKSLNVIFGCLVLISIASAVPAKQSSAAG